MDRDELILQKLSELSTDLKQVQKDVTGIKLQQSEDRGQSEAAILKLDGDCSGWNLRMRRAKNYRTQLRIQVENPYIWVTQETSHEYFRDDRQRTL